MGLEYLGLFRLETGATRGLARLQVLALRVHLKYLDLIRLEIGAARELARLLALILGVHLE